MLETYNREQNSTRIHSTTTKKNNTTVTAKATKTEKENLNKINKLRRWCWFFSSGAPELNSLARLEYFCNKSDLDLGTTNAHGVTMLCPLAYLTLINVQLV